MLKQRHFLVSLAVFCTLASQSAGAALFSDDEARKKILELQDRITAAQSAMIDLNNSNEVLKENNATLVGRVEELEKTVEETSATLKSYYQDINERLKRLEPQTVEVEGLQGTSLPGEKDAYDSALKNFQTGNLPKADSELSAFVKQYPNSPYWPLAQYWLANAKYANRDYANSINVSQALIKRYPDHQRVPDSWLNIANCQIESGQKAAGKKTLDFILNKFALSTAAKSAKQLLSTLK